MYEHVGQVHGADCFHQWYNCLNPNGVALLRTIGAMDQVSPDPWITKNIFPGGYLPAFTELSCHASNANVIITDVENL